ncbi:hypothetical protein CAFE_29650 [Caprobacter fermentans]|uniref:Uncharacterized protein n=1 Tax=Caproicibacter fermentans TaxID=2576756 RepID=A0A6N8I406_9FIRM|nr:hypothetical protein [Caproicibacter fermentans]MVB12233.1 hypothetical protein [Caproicibacter fermentans]OCN01116.1 hypothetical protein A7X67_07015 [Clostridium sp. W14A]QNK39670.1 hypothetical protein HCR03_13150 [Caproicibacter fermentans]
MNQKKLSLRVSVFFLFSLPGAVMFVSGLYKAWSIPSKAFVLASDAVFLLLWGLLLFWYLKKGQPYDEMARSTAVSAASASWAVLAVLLAGVALYCIFTGGTIALTAAVMDFVLAGIDVLYALFFVLYDWRGSAV